jgi:hypothetical protein
MGSRLSWFRRVMTSASRSATVDLLAVIAPKPFTVISCTHKKDENRDKRIYATLKPRCEKILGPTQLHLVTVHMHEHTQGLWQQAIVLTWTTIIIEESIKYFGNSFA